MIKYILAISLALAAPLAAQSNPATYAFKKGKFLYFEGAGNAEPQNDNRTQRRSLSEQAALADAKVKIAYYMQALQNRQGVSLQERMEKDWNVERRVRAFIKGAEPVERKWDERDNCKVLMRIDQKELQRSFDIRSIK